MVFFKGWLPKRLISVVSPMNEVMLEEIVNRYFPTCRSISRDTLARVKRKVLEKMHQKVKDRSVVIAPDNPAQLIPALDQCLEDVISEEWDMLSEEDKVSLRYPTAPRVGRTMQSGGNAELRIVDRKLTKTFTLLYSVEFPDGTIMQDEFNDRKLGGKSGKGRH
jgi:hypothetical protein